MHLPYTYIHTFHAFYVPTWHPTFRDEVLQNVVLLDVNRNVTQYVVLISVLHSLSHTLSLSLYIYI